METGLRLKVSSDRLVKPGIEPATPGLQGKPFINNTMAALKERVQTDSEDPDQTRHLSFLGEKMALFVCH